METYIPGECCSASTGDSFMLAIFVRSTNLLYLLVILTSAPHAAIIFTPDSASDAIPAASLSTCWTTAYLLATNGVMMAYQPTIAMSPLDVTNVSSQLKIQPTMRAMSITETACISEDNRSEIPNCNIFAVMVIMAVVCPGGSPSRVEIGSCSSARR
jgi:hypothetical protein